MGREEYCLGRQDQFKSRVRPTILWALPPGHEWGSLGWVGKSIARARVQKQSAAYYSMGLPAHICLSLLPAIAEIGPP